MLIENNVMMCLIEKDTPTDKSHSKQQDRNKFIKAMIDVIHEPNERGGLVIYC